MKKVASDKGGHLLESVHSIQTFVIDATSFASHHVESHSTASLSSKTLTHTTHTTLERDGLFRRPVDIVAHFLPLLVTPKDSILNLRRDMGKRAAVLTSLAHASVCPHGK